ncbi:MAG: cell wall metabolism sensor histidine kinase WalK [Chloroflexota bacterium]|nr:cell wall metabolism sensor histidine kinase WalK [Chloroflexota bacterium]
MLARMQWRIAIPYTLLIALCLLGLCAYLITFVRQLQLDGVQTRLAAEARLIGEVVAQELADRPPGGPTPDSLARIRDQVDRLARTIDARITVIDGQGAVLADSAQDPALMENHGGRPEVAAALTNGPGEQQRFSATLGRDLFYVAAPIFAGQTVVGVARVAVPLEAVNASLNRIYLFVGAALIVTTAIALGLAVWIAGTVTRPLRQLTAAANLLARGSLHTAVAVQDRGEVGILADSFNRMARQLEHQVASLGRERDIFANVLANMADGIIVVDRRGMVLIANDAARRLLDVAEAPEGLSLARVVRDHEICAALQDALARGMRRTEVRRAGRPARHLRVAAAPLREGGGLLVMRDVSEERRVENLRRDFVANVSHELRTPIAAIKALTETLEEGALDDPPAARDFLRRMHLEVDKLAQLVQELLELSRVESGRAELKLERVDPAELVRSAAVRLRPGAERAGLTLVADPPDDLPSVLADRTRVENVLLALVHNAVKFTGPGGTISLSVGPDGRYARFSVADSGMGIPPEDVPRIFERFYKVDRARSAVGTGLGLAIAKHVVQALGGQIWAESEVGRGTVVRFTLPTASVEPTGQPPSSLAARY